MRFAITIFFTIVLWVSSPVIVAGYYMFSDQVTHECINGMEYFDTGNGYKELKIREGDGVVYCKKNF